MKISFAQILKNMLAQRTRLILTILAVAWGTFTIALMLAVGEGLRLTFGNTMENAGTATLIISGAESSESFHGQASKVKVDFTEDDLQLLKKEFEGKADIAGEIEWNVKLYGSTKKTTRRGRPVMAVSENYGSIHKINVAKPGRFLNHLDDANRRQVIVLGTNTAEKLFKPNENPVGKFVYLDSTPFLVIGVQKETLQLIETGKMPDNFLNWVPYSTYHALTTKRNYSSFTIAPKNIADTPQLENIARQIIAKPRALNPDDPSIISVIHLQEEKEKLNIFFKGIETVLGIIGALTLVVAGVGIANVMYISVKRATREIGIRMALGAKPYEILLYYATEAVLTTALGGILGFLMAFGLVYFIQHIPVHSEVLDHLGNPRPILSFSVILMVMLVLGAIGILAGIFPARKAALINPAEALRHEK